jgi:hypothetical protein
MGCHSSSNRRKDLEKKKPSEKGGKTVELKGKRIVAVGEREGITGPSIKLLAASAGADVVFSVTQCFV